MSFTSRQQGLYRPMVARAWAHEAAAEGFDSRDKVAKDAWYRAELLKCLGRDTTKDCNKGRDFDTVMRHFSALADAGAGFDWEMRAQTGDTRRLQWQIGRICQKWKIDDAYARATAAKLLKWEGYLTSLDQITDAGDLDKVRIALLRHAHRHGVREDRAAAEAINAAPEPRAPVIAHTAEVPELRAIDPYYGATECEFESDGVRERREGKESASRELQRQARKHFTKAARARRAAATEAEIDPENCPF